MKYFSFHFEIRDKHSDNTLPFASQPSEEKEKYRRHASHWKEQYG
jgi:hypothetical protein